MKRRIIAGILCMVLSFSMVGCSKEDKKNDDKEIHEEEKNVLSENQKEALKKEDLPLDYEKLDAIQQIAIGNIGCMMDYIEEKYGKEFEYVAYYMDDTFFEEPYMEVYAKDDEEQRIVEIDTEGYDENKRAIYKDNYLELMATDEYQQAIEDYIKENAPETEFKVFSEVDSVKDSDEEILAKASGSTYILMVNPFGSKDEAKQFADKVIKFMHEKNPVDPIGVYYNMQTEEQFNDTHIGAVDGDFAHASCEYKITSWSGDNDYTYVEIKEK